MKTLTINERDETRFVTIVSDVERTGEGIVIYRDGNPIADLVPHRRTSRRDPHPVLRELRFHYNPTEPLSPEEWPAEEP